MYALCKVRVTIRITAPQPHRSRRHTTRIRHVEWSAVRHSREENIQGQARVLLVFLLAQWEGYFFTRSMKKGILFLAKGKKYLRLHFPDSAIFYRLKVRVGKVG